MGSNYKDIKVNSANDTTTSSEVPLQLNESTNATNFLANESTSATNFTTTFSQFVRDNSTWNYIINCPPPPNMSPLRDGVELPGNHGVELPGNQGVELPSNQGGNAAPIPELPSVNDSSFPTSLADLSASSFKQMIND